MDTRKKAAEEGAFRKTVMKFARFMVASGLSTLLDLGLFYALQRWAVPRVWPETVAFPPLIADVGVLCATAAARVCSAVVNFLLNRNFVFRLKGQKDAVPKYILLCVLVMVADGLIVGRLAQLLPEGVDPFLTTLLKAAVDTVLFVANFYIQKAWVFPCKETEDRGE